MRPDIEKYLWGSDICIISKAQSYQPYSSIQALPVLFHKWNILSIDFMTRLSNRKNRRGAEYESIIIIVDWLIKMVHYELLLTTLTSDQLAAILIDIVIKYHGLPESIVID